MHRKIHTKLLIAEIVLISASVLVFRSGWHLIDKWNMSNDTPILVTTLILGFVVAIPTWRYILNQEDKHYH